MKSRIYNWVLLSLLIFASCNKNEDEVPLSDRNKALLGQWEYHSMMTDRAVDINGDGVVNIDLFNTQEIRQCIKDNLTFFAERGVGERGRYSINENGLTCEDGQQYLTIEEDNYELANNNNIIQFDNRNEMRIIEFSKDKLVIDTDDNLGGTDVTVTITFKRS